MFTYEYSLTGNLDINKLWDLYSIPAKRLEWEPDLEKIDLQGDFITGSTGTMYMKGLPPLPFVLNDVQKHKKFIDTTTLGNLLVEFSHTISEEIDGQLTIKHALRLTTNGDETIETLNEIGKNIVADTPRCMNNLLRLATK